MRSYWEISHDLQNVAALMDAACDDIGEVTDEDVMARLDAWFEALHIEQATKLDSYAHLIQNLQAEAASLKATADGFARAAGKRSRQVDWLKTRIQRELEAQGVNKLQSSLGWVFAIQSNGGKPPVVVEPGTTVDDVEERFLRITKEIDKEAVREAIAAGEQVEFAHIGERGKQLRIRAGV